MSETTPAARVIVLHGDDLYAIERITAAILAKLGDPALVELNLTRLDGRSASLDEMYTAANAMPFLAEKRVLLLTNPFTRLTSEPARQRFRSLLEGLPETALALVVVEDEIDRGKWSRMKDDHWLRKCLNGMRGQAEYRLCQLPAAREMPGWILKETRAQGGQITPAAAAALAQHIGNDTRAATREIEKLLLYVDYKREVEVDEVELLSAQSGQASTFDMVDALGNGNTRLALNLLHRLLEDEDENGLFALIVRQFRLLVQTREVLDEGKRGEAVAQELHIHPYVASKLVDQAGRFTLPRLIAIYRRLLEIEEAYKTGQIPLTVALDTFVAEPAR